MNFITFNFFRTVRKISFIYLRLITGFKILSAYHLSGQRFQIDKSLRAGRGLSIQTDLSETRIRIGRFMSVRNYFHIIMGQKGSLAIGTNCFFNNNCSITCLGKIHVGDNCQFGENVLLYDHNHSYGDRSAIISEQGYATGEIIIGNNCWIGSGVIILKDVVIGDNSVIGAGCVIYRSIPSGSVVYNQQNLVIKSPGNT